MRRPSPAVVLYAHWMRQTGQPVRDPRALAHLAQRHDEDPEPGWYRVRLVRSGPFVPARVWMDQPLDEHGALCADETLRAEIDEAPVSAAALERRWLWMRACSRDDYAALLAERQRTDATGAMFRASRAPVSAMQEFIRP